MFDGIKNGSSLILSSIKVFFKYPVLIFPLLLVWFIYAPIVIFFKWHFDWDAHSTKAIFGIVFLIIFTFSLLLTISCSILLELIQQRETGHKFNLLTSLKDTFTKNIIQIIVLAFIWAVIWFILTVLEAIFSKKDKNNNNETENAENVARTLAGSGGGSWISLTFKALKKGLRMIIFLIMPGFAWEDLSTSKSIKRGLSILKMRTTDFLTGYGLSYLAGFIVFLPPSIMFYLSSKLNIEFPEWSWVACIIYIAFAWSYTIYLEQMFTAELFLWHKKWEREVEKAGLENRPRPKFKHVDRPSILDDIPDLLLCY